MRDTCMLTLTRMTPPFGLLLRTSGLLGPIPCARRQRTSSDQCAWSSHSSVTTCSVSWKIPINDGNVPTSFSPCLGREAQTRKAGEDASYPRQFSQASSREWHLISFLSCSACARHCWKCYDQRNLIGVSSFVSFALVYISLLRAHIPICTIRFFSFGDMDGVG